MIDKSINVLYIDDEPHNLTAFKATFRRDFNIFVADCATKARKIIDENDIHVILSDQRMPITTGIEFFESIIQTYPEPIRILITGYTDISAVVDAINRGQVYKYLTKPWNESDIRIFVTTAYEVFNLRRQNAELSKKLVNANRKLEFLLRQSMLSYSFCLTVSFIPQFICAHDLISQYAILITFGLIFALIFNSK